MQPFDWIKILNFLSFIFCFQACAPRYIWYALTKKRRDPVGTCYVSNGAFTAFEEYSPCRTCKYGFSQWLSS